MRKLIFLTLFFIIFFGCSSYAVKRVSSGLLLSYCTPGGEMADALDWDYKIGLLADYSYSEKIALSTEFSHMQLYSPKVDEFHFFQTAILLGGKYFINMNNKFGYYAKAGYGYYIQWIEYQDEGEEDAGMSGLYLGAGTEYILNQRIVLIGELHYDLVPDTNVLNFSAGVKYRF